MLLFARLRASVCMFLCVCVVVCMCNYTCVYFCNIDESDRGIGSGGVKVAGSLFLMKLRTKLLESCIIPHWHNFQLSG